METLRRLSGSPLPAHSQSAAPGIRPAPQRTASLRIQVTTAYNLNLLCVCVCVCVCVCSCVSVFVSVSVIVAPVLWSA